MVLFRRVPVVIVVAELVLALVLLVRSLSWAADGWTVGEATVRNDYLVRVALLGAMALVALGFRRRRMARRCWSSG